MGAVHWYDVPGADAVPLSGFHDVAAYWSLAGNEIVFAGQAAFDGPTVRHEMLHALTRVGGHPRSEFIVACAGIVDCNEQCMADAGVVRTADSSVSAIAPADLLVDLDVTPTEPSVGANDGFFTVTVSATNPLDTPVRISLRDSSRANFGTTFSYLILGPAGGSSFDVKPADVSAVTFRPHETKIQVFDFRVGFDSTQGMLTPGAYHVSGRFGLSTPWVSAAVSLRP
jgi:hypothetical protein